MTPMTERHIHALKHRRKRVSSSPLIDPEVCCLVLLSPHQQASAGLREPVRRRVARNLFALTTAARIMDVPVFVSGDDSQAFAACLAPGADYRHFTAGRHSSPWLSPQFVAALAGGGSHVAAHRRLLAGAPGAGHGLVCTGRGL